MEHQHQVDLRGLCCAQPIIILTAQLKSIPSGEVLLALADKPSMSLDMPAYCNQTDHTLINHDTEDGVLRFWIRKG